MIICDLHALLIVKYRKVLPPKALQDKAPQPVQVQHESDEVPPPNDQEGILVPVDPNPVLAIVPVQPPLVALQA